jgi:hypothetical protein
MTRVEEDLDLQDLAERKRIDERDRENGTGTGRSAPDQTNQTDTGFTPTAAKKNW